MYGHVQPQLISGYWVLIGFKVVFSSAIIIYLFTSNATAHLSVLRRWAAAALAQVVQLFVFYKSTSAIWPPVTLQEWCLKTKRPLGGSPWSSWPALAFGRKNRKVQMHADIRTEYWSLTEHTDPTTTSIRQVGTTYDPDDRWWWNCDSTCKIVWKRFPHWHILRRYNLR